MPIIVTLTERVIVDDDGSAVLAYARRRAEDWGFPPDYQFTLAEAVRETIVLNECNPLDHLIEIIGSEQHVEHCTDREIIKWLDPDV